MLETKNKKTGLIVLLVLLAAAAVGAYFYFNQNNKPAPTNQPEATKPADTKTLDVTTKTVPYDKLPDQFPPDIPLEKGATVTANYNATTPDGRFQATRTFITAKTLDENYKIYQQAFAKNGWKIVSQGGKDPSWFILAQRNNITALTAIQENTVSHEKTVSITINKLP
jgi:hypothetical protein